MIFTSLLLLLATSAHGQTVYDAAHNITVITGTWSSGSQNVVTGPGFATPSQEAFTYPKTTGMSYSFTDDGYYEIARYRMTSNGTVPTCITGVMNWSHGTYVLASNGSIVMTPFGDGYQQIQDPCAAISNFIENYNYTELYILWNIYQDPVKGYTLQLYQFDGTPLPPQYLVTTSPNMLPTQPLRNVSTITTTSAIVKNAAVVNANAGERRWEVASMTGLLTVISGLGLAALLL
ncbi:chaperone for protein-folding within the ER, fungal-domain-containing protein [Suillus bovinus]|uniref:chaperone for protein-folding within the ER, fungal-domain-containing protein n=1 Tax=Suillus bovinus TaxID=48563 RepID=UPI001B87C6AA|nr:chaperone for protein-folding within the ER, fungal-domain-containing protein [Suillus bovinus]KAG2139593.1 chaperone for protein-folding within the ER, fungal-domain-containing protein [Suillus bovinus]